MGPAGTGLRPPVNNALDMGSLVLNVIGHIIIKVGAAAEEPLAEASGHRAMSNPGKSEMSLGGSMEDG